MWIYRAWQRKLHHLVQNEEHRAEIYSCLWMLISEQEKKKFHEMHAGSLCVILARQGNQICDILPERI